MKSLPFLWEIGCEELPAGWVGGLLEQLRVEFAAQLEGARLAASAVETEGTLRRLVVHVPGVPERQPSRRDEVLGPPARIARTGAGEWGPPALGFARKNEIHPRRLTLFETPKGDYVGFVREVKGQPARKLLPSLMAATLRRLHFPKSMSWDAEIPDGEGPLPFGRPIRWMVCLLGDRVVPFEIRLNGGGRVRASNRSRGHRFLASRGAKPGAVFPASSYADLKRGLAKRYVLLDRAERRDKLESELRNIEEKAAARRAPGLSVELVADVVEWPGAFLGAYPEEFSALPVEVRHTVLIHHQKYFPLEGKPAFIAVANMPSDPRGHVRKGSERVVVARLRDAKFFWDEDLKKPLASRRRALGGVLFHQKLGTYELKVDRIVPFSRWLAEKAATSAPLLRSVKDAAELAKCDLTTEMVKEFPELQGIIGGLYAREQGEPEEVWRAVYSHYRPGGLTDPEDFPLNLEGAIVSLADKLDTLAGMFAIGVVPTGSRDPFGLRRAALGAIRILLEMPERFGVDLAIASRRLLDEALQRVHQQLGDGMDRAAPDALREFFTERLRFVFQRRHRYDEVNAVFSLGALELAPAELARRLEALAKLRGSSDFEALSIAFKRVRNILSDHPHGLVHSETFTEEAERELWASFQEIEPRASSLIAERRYEEALRTLSQLRPQVDRFFDEVLVMDPDPRRRENRLALLYSFQSLFTRVADLSEIVAEGGASRPESAG